MAIRSYLVEHGVFDLVPRALPFKFTEQVGLELVNLLIDLLQTLYFRLDTGLALLCLTFKLPVRLRCLSSLLLLLINRATILLFALNLFEALLELLAIEQIVFCQRYHVGKRSPLVSARLSVTRVSILSIVVEQGLPVVETNRSVLRAHEVL